MRYNSTQTRFAVTTFIAGLASTGLAQSAEPARKSDKRPNILVILADDLGYSDIGCYGGEIETPNLNFLAANGLRFNQFYNTSRSCPTRASLLTGLYPHQAGIGRMTFDAHLPGYRGTLSSNAVTIAEVLRGAGYNTGMVGKWHVAETPLRKDQRNWLNHQVFYEEFADKRNYPVNRGFNDYYGTIYGVVDYFDPFSLVEGDKPIDKVPEGYYITDAIADKTTEYIRNYAASDKPFFIYLSFTAPHWPLQARESDIEKYKDVYTCGWDAIRQQRYQRMQKLGIFGGAEDFLTDRQFKDSWESNPTQEWDARAMAVHAAMVDCMDRGIGRVIETLRQTGELDNTLILFMSDNGCSNEECQNMMPGENDRPDMTRDGRRIVYPKNKEVLPGPETTYAALGARWANVANTPFRFWKAKSYEGGICTPMIAFWPKGIKHGSNGKVTSEKGHVIDIMATCVDLAKADYPEKFNGNTIIPLEGNSLKPIFTKGSRKGNSYGFEHFTQRAFLSNDNWKIVMAGDGHEWELYNLNTDRTEKHNLAGEYPEKVAELATAYRQWAERCMVEPYPGQKKKNK